MLCSGGRPDTGPGRARQCAVFALQDSSKWIQTECPERNSNLLCCALLQIRPACSPLEVLRPRRSRRRRPLLPVGPKFLERSCGTDSSAAATCCFLLPVVQ
jgi:hypothetical protein